MRITEVDSGEKIKALASEMTLDNFDVVSQQMIAWAAVPKIKALLDSITADNFDSVSDQVISWVKKVEIHHILQEFTVTILEKANNETVSGMCAQLCKDIKNNIRPKAAGGNAISNAITDDPQLFEDLSRTLYEAIHIKRKSRGFFKFMGELFKLNVLAESVIHAQVGSILYGTRNEEDIEALCVLLKEVGQLLDVPKGNACMESYCLRMKELIQGPSVGPQTVLSLQGVLDLRERNWEGDTTPELPSGDTVTQRVTVLLDKLTLNNVDSVSKEVILLCNKSSSSDDSTLHKIIGIIYDKATRNKNMSEIYARLCLKMKEYISPLFQDKGIKNAEGEPIRGGQLFMKYLLNRCQVDFERVCAIRDPDALKPLILGMKICSDLVRFLGELFKLQLLTERVMHECIKALLSSCDSVENPTRREYFMEMLCELLVTVGHILDTPKAKAHMDVYFSRIIELSSNQGLSPRVMSMLQEVILLRERKWALAMVMQFVHDVVNVVTCNHSILSTLS